MLQAGDFIPADGVIISGHIDCDCAMLSVKAPLSTSAQKEVFAGTQVVNGEAKCEIKTVGVQSRMGAHQRHRRSQCQLNSDQRPRRPHPQLVCTNCRLAGISSPLAYGMRLIRQGCLGSNHRRGHRRLPLRPWASRPPHSSH